MKKQIELSYIAGLFDGEGYAGVSMCYRWWNTKKGKSETLRPRPEVAVAMTDKEPVFFINKIFPRKTGIRLAKRRTKSGKKVWVWSMVCRQALYFAKTILPFSKNKKKQNQLKKVIGFYGRR